MTLTEILREKGIYPAGEEHRHAGRGWVQYDCPFCGQDSGKYHLGWNPERMFFHCWACGYHSNFQTIQSFLACSSRQAAAILKQIGQKTPCRARRATETVQGVYREPGGVGGLKKAHRAYLHGRGFSSSMLDRVWGIRGTGHNSEIPWRIFIPVFYRGDPVSWTARVISENTPLKYISAKAEQEKIQHKKILYGGDYVRGTVIVVEGPTDVWRIGPGAVATFGLSVSDSQIYRISKIPRRFLCFDNSRDAQRKAGELADCLALFPGETSILQIDADDPGAASRRDVKKIRRHCFGGQA